MTKNTKEATTESFLQTNIVPTDEINIKKKKTLDTKIWLFLGRGKLKDSAIDAESGAIAGLLAGIVVCPLDVIKTQQQATGMMSREAIGNKNSQISQINLKNANENTILNTIRHIYKTDGLKGFYRGLTPITLGYLPTWMVYFTVYGRLRQTLTKCFENDSNDTIIFNNSNNNNININNINNNSNSNNKCDIRVNVLSAIGAGGTSTIITNPIWVVKTRLMSQTIKSASWRYTSTLNAFITIYKKEGFFAFYSGIAPALLGLTHVAVQFPLYEYLKTIFNPQPSSIISMENETTTERLRRLRGIAAASILSKMCASLITYPHEVVRTSMQIALKSDPDSSSIKTNPSTNFTPVENISNHCHTIPIRDANPTSINNKNINANTLVRPSFMHVIKTLYKSYGWRGFYFGLGTNLIRVVPASAVTLLTYETVSYELRIPVE